MAVTDLYLYNGGFSLPFLLHLYDKGRNIDIRLINDSEGCAYEGETYKAGTFRYTPNASEQGLTGGGTLEIFAGGYGSEVTELVKLYSDITAEIVGVMMEDGTITELRHFKHHNGKVKVDRKSVTFTFSRDERLDMTFPALVWNSQNNRGNS